MARPEFNRILNPKPRILRQVKGKGVMQTYLWEEPSSDGHGGDSFSIGAARVAVQARAASTAARLRRQGQAVPAELERQADGLITEAEVDAVHKR